MTSKAQTKRCANPDCAIILQDDEVDFRDGLCNDCWLRNCRGST